MRVLSFRAGAMVLALAAAMPAAVADSAELSPVKTIDFAGYATHLYKYHDSVSNTDFAWSISRVQKEGYILGWFGSPSDVESSSGTDSAMVFVLASPNPAAVSIKDVQEVIFTKIKDAGNGHYCATTMNAIYKDGDFTVSDKKLEAIVSVLLLDTMEIVQGLPGDKGVRLTDASAFTGLSACSDKGGTGDKASGADYSAGAEAAKALSLASGLKSPVAEYHADTGRWPADNAAAGARKPGALGDGKYISRVVVTDGRIMAMFCTSADESCEADMPLRGHSLTLIPAVGAGGGITFTCHVDNASIYKYVEPDCRHLLPGLH